VSRWSSENGGVGKKTDIIICLAHRKQTGYSHHLKKIRGGENGDNYIAQNGLSGKNVGGGVDEGRGDLMLICLKSEEGRSERSESNDPAWLCSSKLGRASPHLWHLNELQSRTKLGRRASDHCEEKHLVLRKGGPVKRRAEEQPKVDWGSGLKQDRRVQRSKKVRYKAREGVSS